jgi:PadR family transcriptional regulator PadR
MYLKKIYLKDYHTKTDVLRAWSIDNRILTTLLSIYRGPIYAWMGGRHVDLEDKEFWKSQINLGLSRFFLLMVLRREHMHGYGAVQEMARLSDGCCMPTLATVYPLLAEMERDGYTRSVIETVGGRERKVYILTPRGERAYQAALSAWKEVLPIVRKAFEEAKPVTKEKKFRPATKVNEEVGK